jgi:hypothetical protein
MKCLAAFVIIFLFLSIPSFGQLEMMQTLGSAGGNSSNSNASLDWSLGQVAVSTLVSSEAILTQGLLQENLLITRIGLHSEKLADVSVYPNPTAGNLMVVMSENKPLTYSITDLDGKLLLKGRFSDIQNTLDISGLPAGEYFLNISEKTAQNVNSYKIVKL